MSTAMLARTVGSPPVRRTDSMPNRSTIRDVSRWISSKVRISARGTHSIPSLGMQ